MNRKIYRSIIFSKSQLKTQLKFGDYFQIYPCDFKKAPASPYCSDFPLVIEYYVDEVPEVKLPDELQELSTWVHESTQKINQLNRLLRLLSVLTNHRFFIIEESGYKWGKALPDLKLNENEKEAFNSSSSQTFSPGFYYPSIADDLCITDFSEQKFPVAVLIEHTKYYRRVPSDDRDIDINFPNTIYQSVDKYFSLDNNRKKVANSVNHLICNGIEIKDKMKSLSFLSFVSAIETIVNYEFKKKNDVIEFECNDCQTIKTSQFTCPKCQRPIWGVKTKFKEFLKTYVSGTPKSIEKYNKIYNLRSKIVHAGVLLLGDEEIDWGESLNTNEQYTTYYESMQLARESLSNWLLKGANNISV